MTATAEAPAAPLGLDYEQLLTKTAAEKDHLVVLDGASRARLLDAEQDLAEAERELVRERELLAGLHGDRLGPPPDPDPKYALAIADAEKALKAAEADARSHALVLRLRGLGKHEYDELMSDWPPTDDQLAKAKADAALAKRTYVEPAYDPVEFQPALIAACVVNVKMTQAQAKALWTTPGWNSRDLLDLFFGCQDVCAIGGHVDLGNGLSSTPSSGPSSTTASRKGSRTAST